MQSLDIETNNQKTMSFDSKKYEVKDERLSINDDAEENFLIYKKPKRKFNLKFPFIIYIVLFTFILFIASIIALFAIKNKYKPNYEFYLNIYKKPFISEHNYSKLIFDNNLEIILTQVHYDDNAGGALCFEKGYLDLQYDPGLLKLTLLSLRKNDRESLTELRDYMGELSQSTEEFYSTLYFTILNSGFEKFLKNFKEYTSHDNNDNNELINITRRSIRRFNSYSPTYSTVEEREKYLVEYLIYNITDKNGKDIIRQGTADEVNKTLNGSYGILGGIMDNLFATKKMKLIFFSHYKMSLMKRYILRYLKDLGKHERQEPDSDPKNITQYETIITDKVIYHKIKDSDENYIKINYYVTNPEANISQLYLDSGYFNYLKYILDETNQDSLYYNLTHPSEKEGINIKSLSCDFEVVLKNRIRFSILIKLNHYSYKHIKQIIEIVYDYMEKIKTHINNLSPNDPRVNELYYINNQNFSFTEDIHTAEFYKNKAKDLFYRDQEDFFLREVWIPPDLNKSTTNIRYYIDQLRMNNSVIIIGLKDKTKNKYNINETDINLIFNNIQETNNLNITFSINELKELNINMQNNKDLYELKYYRNEFISNFSNDYEVPKMEAQNNESYTCIGNSDNLVKFYWLKDTSFKLPKVYVIFYFFHPFHRPNSKTEEEKDKIFFHLMLYLSYIQREIELQLSDAKRAGNNFKIGFVENYLFLNVMAYSDVIENILNIVKKRIITIQNINITEIYEIYKDYALENLLNFGESINTELKYEFYKYLTSNYSDFPPAYNHYAFPKEKFENFTEIMEEYILAIKMPIFYIFTMGFYDKDPLILYNIFKDFSNYKNFNYTMILAGYNNSFISGDQFVNKFIEKPLIKGGGINKLNYSKIKNNLAYSFMNFVQFSDYNRIPFEMLSRIFQDNRRRNSNINLEVMNQKYIYLRFSYPENNSTEEIKNYILGIINDKNITEDITKDIDIFGGRFYYLVKNMEISFTKNPNDLRNAALEFSYNQVYNRVRTDDTYKISTSDNYKKFKDIIEKFFNDYPEYVEFSNKKIKI